MQPGEAARSYEARREADAEERRKTIEALDVIASFEMDDDIEAIAFKGKDLVFTDGYSVEPIPFDRACQWWAEMEDIAGRFNFNESGRPKRRAKFMRWIASAVAACQHRACEITPDTDAKLREVANLAGVPFDWLVNWWLQGDAEDSLEDLGLISAARAAFRKSKKG